MRLERDADHEADGHKGGQQEKGLGAIEGEHVRSSPADRCTCQRRSAHPELARPRQWP